MIRKEQTERIVEKLTKEALGKMTDEELIERIPKISLKKNGTTLEEIVFTRIEEQINAMVENYEFKRRFDIDKNEIITKDEAREKIINMYKKCIFWINLIENMNGISHECGEECRKDLRKQIKKMQKYKNLF